MNPLIGLTALALGISWLADSRRGNASKVQKCFERFHERIRLSEDNQKAKLREKRQALLDDLRCNLGPTAPAFEWFNQGSYAMHTGIVPRDGDYDIDVGLVFDCARSAYSDPVALKVLVRDAMKRSARTVQIRRSCVTAQYLRTGIPAYHVDLAVYVKRKDGLLDIAKGKEYSEPEYRRWEKADPKGLTRVLANRYSGEELSQYRRCIRYMKRWRDLKFSAGAPVSIALTVAAYLWFEPRHQALGASPRDLDAMRDWTKAILNRFSNETTREGPHERLRIALPVEPHVDLLAKLSKTQMGRLQAALASLHASLHRATNATTLDDCKALLAEQFGTEFG